MVLWGWKKKNHALLGSFLLMTLSLVLVLAWESSGPGGFTGVYQQDPPKLVNLRFRDAVKTQALLASAEEWDESGKAPPDSSEPFNVPLAGQVRGLCRNGHQGEKMLEADPTIWKDTEVKINLESSHEVAVRRLTTHESKISSFSPQDVGLKGLTIREAGTGKDRLPAATSNLITETTPLELQLDPSLVPEKPFKSPISGNASIAGPELSKPFVFEDSRSRPEVCDLTKGYWVKDDKRPLYSGKECKAYLSSGFACRLTTRPDFEFEKLRWQPEGCDLPPFTAEGFLHRLRNKVVAFVGDSLGRQQFQSLMCMITNGKDRKSVENVNRNWGRETRWAYRFRETNTTILFHWSASLCEIEKGHPNEEPGYSAMHLDRPASFLKKFLHKIDVLVLNTGHHWNHGKLQSNKWHQYVDGKPLVDPKLAGITYAFNFTVHKVVKWLDEKLADGNHKPAVFFRTLSPRHFKNGDWDSGGTCDSTRSHYASNMTANKEVELHLPVYKGPIAERVAETAVGGTRLNLLNITNLSQFREEGHISKYGIGKDSVHQDCLHWCLPGVPDVWNEVFYANLLNDPSLGPISDDQLW